MGRPLSMMTRATSPEVATRTIARLKSVTENYPLYSGADESLYLLGQSYERLADAVRANPRLPEAMRAKLINEYSKHAVEAYDRILTRYPATDRVGDATERLQAMKQPIPTPTAAALERSKKEEASRSEQSRVDKVMGLLRQRPDTTHAATVGEPNLEEPKEVSATDLAQHRIGMALRLAEPDRAPAGPHQAPAVHDTMVLPGRIAVTHRAGIADGIGQLIAERCGDDCRAEDRQQRVRGQVSENAGRGRRRAREVLRLGQP